MSKYVYILQEYAFYDCLTIMRISKDYKTIKKYFDEIDKENGHGYQITKYECDVIYDNFDLSYDGIMDWVEIGYNGEIKNKINNGDVDD